MLGHFNFELGRCVRTLESRFCITPARWVLIQKVDISLFSFALASDQIVLLWESYLRVKAAVRDSLKLEVDLVECLCPFFTVIAFVYGLRCCTLSVLKIESYNSRPIEYPGAVVFSRISIDFTCIQAKLTRYLSADDKFALASPSICLNETLNWILVNNFDPRVRSTSQ